MSFSNFLAKTILDHVFMESSFTMPTNLWVGLSITDPGETGSQSGEVSGGSYARVSTADLDWDAGTNSDPSTVNNATIITFPTATADWESGSNITHVFVADASSSGNILMSTTVTIPKSVNNGDTAQFAIGAISISLD